MFIGFFYYNFNCSSDKIDSVVAKLLFYSKSKIYFYIYFS